MWKRRRRKREKREEEGEVKAKCGEVMQKLMRLQPFSAQALQNDVVPSAHDSGSAVKIRYADRAIPQCKYWEAVFQGFYWLD